MDNSASSTVILPTCSFTYISVRTGLPVHVTGVERTWEYLKSRFNRVSEGLPDTSAKYYETIGYGPFLFAVVNDVVFYHEDEKWCQYKSGGNVKYDTVNIDE